MLWWQTLPERFDGIAFSFLTVSIPWYTVCYIFGILLATVFSVSLARRRQFFTSEETTIELIVSVLWGVIIGARLGFDDFLWR